MSGEPLLLLPGFMADARAFWPQIVALSAGRAVQVAAYGTADTVEAMARDALAAAPPDFALAGHGLGGAVALEMLRREPERITRLALIAPLEGAGSAPEAEVREPAMAMARAGRMAEAMEAALPPAALAPGSGRAMLRATLLDMADRLGAAAFLAQSRALIRRPDPARVLRATSVPALVLGGRHDRLCPPERLADLAAALGGAALVVLEDAGHLPMLERPAPVSAALQDWLDAPFLLRKPLQTEGNPGG